MAEEILAMIKERKNKNIILRIKYFKKQRKRAKKIAPKQIQRCSQQKEQK